MPVTDPAPDVWNDTLLQNPHEVSDKRSRVQKMFAAIAPSYDLNNRLHSLGMDQRWRRKATQLAQLDWTQIVIDVACGTGDLALEFSNLGLDLTQTIVGVDFTYEMLRIAQTK